MDQTNMPILTPYNYFEWKSCIAIHLRKAGLNRITIGLETEPNKDEDKPKWFNKCDEAYGTLCLFVSLDLLFHIECLDTQNEIWTKLEILFGTQDSMRGHMLENELITLSPRNFNTI